MGTVLHKDQIVVPEREPFEREEEPEFCEHLAETFRVEGMLHPLVVRDIGDEKYELVCGRKRLAAWCGILGQEHVECEVKTMDDDEARASKLAENIWRLPLTGPQMKLALIEWRKVHTSIREANANRGEAQGGTKGFTSTIQSSLDIGRRTATKLSQMAKNLKPEDVHRMESLNANEAEYYSVAKLREPEAIEDAISIAERETVPIEEAVRRAKRNAEIRAVVKPKPAVPAKSPKPEPLVKKELTDDEWLDQECGTILNQLKRKGPFKRDAILYRRFHKKAVAFREFVKPFLKAAKHPDGNGACYGTFYRLTYMSHPGSWWVCGQCEGSGTANGDKCNLCGGSAYRLKTEQF